MSGGGAISICTGGERRNEGERQLLSRSDSGNRRIWLSQTALSPEMNVDAGLLLAGTMGCISSGA